MYVFNAGGTMTESSNYDSLPPGPPAYGVWRKTGPRQYEAKYKVFQMKTPASFSEVTKDGGWSPDGEGVLFEKITLSEDGNSFSSTIKFDTVDHSGKPTVIGGEGTVRGVRMGF